MNLYKYISKILYLYKYRKDGMIMGKAATKAKNKYNEANYDRINVSVPKGKKEKIKEYAESKGESVNGFINRAIDKAMEE